MHYYGYPTEEAVMALTPGQFAARMNDVGEIESMKNGKGKGRVRRDRRKWTEFFRRTGTEAPRGYKA